jgi:homoserine dehydrogenase
MTRVTRVGVIGFGGVGQAFAQLLEDRGDWIKSRWGREFRLVAVVDRRRGSLACAAGLRSHELLAAARCEPYFTEYPDHAGLERGGDLDRVLRVGGADVLVELTPTTADGQPAVSHCQTAFRIGRHVVTANKGPAVHAYTELMALANAHGVTWGLEGTVMSGTPVLRFGRQELAGCRIRAVRGVLNGTVNFMLERMEEGQSFDEALASAQALGYAEADPTADVDGWDAAYKLVIVGRHVLGVPLTLDQVAREGIRSIGSGEVMTAARRGRRWKLVAELDVHEDDVRAAVGPVALPEEDPLAGCRGATNALTYVTDLLGPVTLQGPGAGRRETAFAVLSDLLELPDRKS